MHVNKLPKMTTKLLTLVSVIDESHMFPTTTKNTHVQFCFQNDGFHSQMFQKTTYIRHNDKWSNRCTGGVDGYTAEQGPIGHKKSVGPWAGASVWGDREHFVVGESIHQWWRGSKDHKDTQNDAKETQVETQKYIKQYKEIENSTNFCYFLDVLLEDLQVLEGSFFTCLCPGAHCLLISGWSMLQYLNVGWHNSGIQFEVEHFSWVSLWEIGFELWLLIIQNTISW